MTKILAAAASALLLATPALAADAPAGGASPNAAEAKELFKKKCAMCHGEDGRAQTKMGQKHNIPSFVDPEFWTKHDEAEIKDVITNGVKDTKMKPWKDKLTPAEIDGLAQHVKSFRPAAK